MKRVYLAGAIFGLADRGQGWREVVIENLPLGWEAVNPNLIEIDKVDPHELIAGDYATILSCRAVLVRADKPSWGTAMELAFARQHGIPVVAWDVPETCSPWLLGHVRYICPSVGHALEVLRHEF